LLELITKQRARGHWNRVISFRVLFDNL